MAAPRPRDVAVVCGQAWWCDEPHDSKLTEGRLAHLAAIALVAGSSLLALVRLSASPHGFARTPADVAASSFPGVLLWFRCGCLILSVGTVAFKWRNKAMDICEWETLDGRQVTFICRGLWRFQGLTSWTWLTIVSYFSVTTLLSIYVVVLAPGAPQHLSPSGAAVAAQLLQEVVTPCSFLVSCIVTYVLIPAKLKERRPVDEFFYVDVLLMHNANLAMLVPELLLNRMHIELAHMPVAILFACVYILWHQTVRYERTHTMMYSFLSWKSEHRFKIIAALASVFAAFYLFAFVVCEYLRPSTYGPPLVVAVAVSLMQIRQPHENRTTD